MEGWQWPIQIVHDKGLTLLTLGVLGESNSFRVDVDNTDNERNVPNLDTRLKIGAGPEETGFASIPGSFILDIKAQSPLVLSINLEVALIIWCLPIQNYHHLGVAIQLPLLNWIGRVAHCNI